MAVLKETPAAKSPEWQALVAHATVAQTWQLGALFQDDSQRFSHFSVRWNDWLLDYSKSCVRLETIHYLLELWHAAGVKSFVERMCAGETINHTEGRPVLHHALRQPSGALFCQGHNIISQIHAVLERMEKFVEAVHAGAWRGATGDKITDIVNIGIGGSDLGPRMATRALMAYRMSEVRVHYVANIDGADLATVLADLVPERTLFVIVSKTFTTQETMQNARSARLWLTQTCGEMAVCKHFVAVSTNGEEVVKFGILPDNIFEFWDWVGGRFSVWSAVGLSLALAIGFKHFRAFLAGAHAMDRHFFSTPPTENLPTILALLDVWNHSLLGLPTRVVLPYSQSLELLPRYLQQLEMESNGKRVNRSGEAIDHPTQAILWGEAGTNGQHAFYQLLHQGGQRIPCEFIAFIRSEFPLAGHHEKLLANCFAQSKALLFGKAPEQARAELAGLPQAVAKRLLPYKQFAGNQPSTTLLLPVLDPFQFGALLALYEHKVLVSSCIWNLNAFDQWGVEYGKQLANTLLPVITGKATLPDLDSSTSGLIAAVQKG